VGFLIKLEELSCGLRFNLVRACAPPQNFEVMLLTNSFSSCIRLYLLTELKEKYPHRYNKDIHQKREREMKKGHDYCTSTNIPLKKSVAPE
jgi:hypothetical protein